MSDVNMASHELRTAECEQFVRLYWNHVFIIQRAKTTRTRIRVYSDRTRQGQNDGVKHNALDLEHMLVNRSIQTGRVASKILYNRNAVDLKLTRPV